MKTVMMVSTVLAWALCFQISAMAQTAKIVPTTKLGNDNCEVIEISRGKIGARFVVSQVATCVSFNQTGPATKLRNEAICYLNADGSVPTFQKCYEAPGPAIQEYAEMKWDDNSPEGKREKKAIATLNDADSARINGDYNGADSMYRDAYKVLVYTKYGPRVLLSWASSSAGTEPVFYCRSLGSELRKKNIESNPLYSEVRKIYDERGCDIIIASAEREMAAVRQAEAAERAAIDEEERAYAAELRAQDRAFEAEIGRNIGAGLAQSMQLNAGIRRQREEEAERSRQRILDAQRARAEADAEARAARAQAAQDIQAAWAQQAARQAASTQVLAQTPPGGSASQASQAAQRQREEEHRRQQLAARQQQLQQQQEAERRQAMANPRYEHRMTAIAGGYAVHVLNRSPFTIRCQVKISGYIWNGTSQQPSSAQQALVVSSGREGSAAFNFNSPGAEASISGCKGI